MCNCITTQINISISDPLGEVLTARTFLDSCSRPPDSLQMPTSQSRPSEKWSHLLIERVNSFNIMRTETGSLSRDALAPSEINSTFLTIAPVHRSKMPTSAYSTFSTAPAAITNNSMTLLCSWSSFPLERRQGHVRLFEAQSPEHNLTRGG
jgi:hypothetical protein